ncbi:MAG: hypothetical protein AB1540_13960, partial [Bdellovibrionota bacterium]
PESKYAKWSERLSTKKITEAFFDELKRRGFMVPKKGREQWLKNLLETKVRDFLVLHTPEDVAAEIRRFKIAVSEVADRLEAEPERQKVVQSIADDLPSSRNLLNRAPLVRYRWMHENLLALVSAKQKLRYAVATLGINDPTLNLEELLEPKSVGKPGVSYDAFLDWGPIENDVISVTRAFLKEAGSKLLSVRGTEKISKAFPDGKVPISIEMRHTGISRENGFSNSLNQLKVLVKTSLDESQKPLELVIDFATEKKTQNEILSEKNWLTPLVRSLEKAFNKSEVQSLPSTAACDRALAAKNFEGSE